MNANDVMANYMRTGCYEPSESQATISNAMDVGDPSNRPRLEWLYGDDLKRMQREFEREFSFRGFNAPIDAKNVGGVEPIGVSAHRHWF